MNIILGYCLQCNEIMCDGVDTEMVEVFFTFHTKEYPSHKMVILDGYELEPPPSLYNPNTSAPFLKNFK